MKADESAARIMVYFDVGNDHTTGPNITAEQFRAHMRELALGPYNVISLEQLINNYNNNKKMPPNSIVLTFDGGHKSILKSAIPLLEKLNFPYTVFIASERANQNNNQYLSWRDLKKIKKSKLSSLGMHPASYTNLSSEPADEIKRQINNTKAMFRNKLNFTPQLFAYPFGAYDYNYSNIVASQGFEGILGQQSGVAYASENLNILPRFTMTDEYGDLDRFITVANALPLPVKDVTTALNKSIGFTLPRTLSTNKDKLSCFASGQSKPRINILSDTRIELHLSKNTTQQRLRVNCMLPVSNNNSDEIRFRWLGMLFTN